MEDVLLEEPIEVPVNIISIYRFYRSEAERKKVERLMNAMLHKRPLLVRGFFGEGKSRAGALSGRGVAELMLLNKSFVKRYGRIQVIFACPLRALRDEVYKTYFFDIGFVLKAHDEVCPLLKQRLRQGKEYLIALAEHLKSDTCLYSKHIGHLKQAMQNGRVVVTTHTLSILPVVLSYAMKRKPLVIFDEAEDFLERVSRGLNEDIVEAVKRIDIKLYRKIRRMLQKEQHQYFMRYTTFKQLLRDSVFISATFPRVIEENYHLLVDRELEVTWLFSVGEKRQDVMVIYKGKLLWKDYPKWKPTVQSQVAELVRVTTSKYGVVGIASRNYQLTRDLEAVLSSMGFKVVSDLDPDFRSKILSSEVIIVTTKGRLYRGINILRGISDVPVVIGFYQGAEPKEHYPPISDYILEHCGEEIFKTYVRELVYAKNLQSLYRFIRQRKNRHIMVLFDWRFHEAFYHFFRNKLYDEIVRVEVDGLSRVSDVAKLYI
uniref:Helicase ATP-binding domain-containing protein n=1 Tax=Ignisphaera aggregans TaxID=334771 RepID=A0A7J2TCC3_9CREN